MGYGQPDHFVGGRLARDALKDYPKKSFPARRDRMLCRFSNTAAPNSPRHSIRSRPSGFSSIDGDRKKPIIRVYPEKSPQAYFSFRLAAA